MPPRKGPKKKRRLPKYLSESQVRLFFQKIPVPDDEYRIAFKLMYLSLLRVSEVCNLYVRDLDFAQGALMILDSKSGDRRIDLNPDFALELRNTYGRRGGTTMW